MRYFKNRSNYWSCSKFADWLYSVVDVEKPSSATSQGWRTWKNTTKKLHPFVYDLIEEKFDLVQDIIMFPYDIYDNVRCYLRNRFISKLHYLPTRLTPGEYWDVDHRMIHGLFETLVDFVEIEKAHMSLWSHSDKPRPWWYRFRFTRWGEFRSRELGFEYLHWEETLVDEDTHELTHQAQIAQEIMELYIWWKDVRPHRIDPMEASGWSNYCQSKRANDEDGLPFIDGNDSDITRPMLKEIDELEKQYDDEDERMMIRLIKIRKGLWT